MNPYLQVMQDAGQRQLGAAQNVVRDMQQQYLRPPGALGAMNNLGGLGGGW